jgi:hypothetical protein
MNAFHGPTCPGCGSASGTVNSGESVSRPALAVGHLRCAAGCGLDWPGSAEEIGHAMVADKAWDDATGAIEEAIRLYDVHAFLSGVGIADRSQPRRERRCQRRREGNHRRRAGRTMLRQLPRQATATAPAVPRQLPRQATCARGSRPEKGGGRAGASHGSYGLGPRPVPWRPISGPQRESTSMRRRAPRAPDP